MKDSADLLARYRIDEPKRFRLKDFDPDDTGGLRSKEKAEADLQAGAARLGELQDRLFAQDRWAVLVIVQGMDAAGKDGVIRHVMSDVSPQAVEVHSFKAPSDEALSHDFLWRHVQSLPERGHIGIHNRSHYEEVLIVRVHEEILAGEMMPPELVDAKIWAKRFESIREFERHLVRNGTVVLKFFLNLSKEEQRKRFLARLDEPAKNWKFRADDIRERQFWDGYMKAYDEMIQQTSTAEAPWYVVPADHKWFTRLVVAEAVVAEMEKLGLEYPKVEGAEKAALDVARKTLAAEGDD